MSELERIAHNMRRTLALSEARFVHYKLRRGLELVLERKERGYRLALGRTDTQPSDVEIEVCAQAFAAPPDVALMRTTKTRQGKSGQMTYHVAELFWSELN